MFSKSLALFACIALVIAAPAKRDFTDGEHCTFTLTPDVEVDQSIDLIRELNYGKFTSLRHT
jgi:hypothetical protein